MIIKLEMLPTNLKSFYKMLVLVRILLITYTYITYTLYIQIPNAIFYNNKLYILFADELSTTGHPH